MSDEPYDVPRDVAAAIAGVLTTTTNPAVHRILADPTCLYPDNDVEAVGAAADLLADVARQLTYAADYLRSTTERDAIAYRDEYDRTCA